MTRLDTASWLPCRTTVRGPSVVRCLDRERILHKVGPSSCLGVVQYNYVYFCSLLHAPNMRAWRVCAVTKSALYRRRGTAAPSSTTAREAVFHTLAFVPVVKVYVCVVGA